MAYRVNRHEGRMIGHALYSLRELNARDKEDLGGGPGIRHRRAVRWRGELDGVR